MKIVSDASATARVVSVLESFVRESTTAHAVRHGTDNGTDNIIAC